MKKIITALFVLAAALFLVACGNTEVKESPVKVYTRDTTSGTRGAFFEIVGLKDLAGTNEGLVEGFVEVASNGDMLSSVNNDKNGIGYVSLSSLTNSTLKALNYNGVEATEANVLANKYELKRPFMFIRKADEDIQTEDEKLLVNAFLSFMDTKEGKEIIYNNDGIVEGIDQAPTWDSIKANHADALKTGTDVEIHFGGSTSVEKIAKALSSAFDTIAPRFKPMHAHAGSGAAFTGTRNDGNLHIGFASRELKDTEKVTGQFGQVAWDAVVLVVNKDNKTTNVTTKHVQDIFTGEVKNWEDIK